MSSIRSKKSLPLSKVAADSQVLTKEELEELQRTLPSWKKFTEGRTYIKRKSKRRAEYWDCFMEYLEGEQDSPMLLRAECKFCDKTFAADSNVNGSKNVKIHWEKCIRNPANKGKGKQAELFFEPGDVDGDGEEVEGKLKYGTVNLKDVRDALLRMIIVDELPFRHVEKDGFKHLMSVACPRFHLPSRTTVGRDCLALYLNEKQTLKDMLKNSCQRISVTTDTWTSIQRINYMCLTAHFIDNEWTLHKRIINFCPISSHKGEDIGKAVESCLEAWGIEDKLFSVTVDNASANDVACSYLKKMVNRSVCIREGKYLHIRCMAHIINLIVWDGIKDHGVCINRVRAAVKYIKNSPARIQRFKDLVQKLNINCKLSLSLDVPTRWNSTYIMLETALNYQRVFGGLNLPDGDDVESNELPPNADDWKKVGRLVVFLKGFYLLTRRISGSKYVTSDKGFLEIASVLDMLKKWEKNVDPDFRGMAISMKKKYDKYWGDVDKMNMMIYIAVVLDPHSKLLVVEITLKDMYGEDKGIELANKVRNLAYSLFDEYRALYSPMAPESEPMSDTPNNQQDEGGSGGTMSYVKSLKDRAKRLKGTSGNARSEFNRYLNEILGEDEEGLNVLSWWRLNAHRYPIVSRMARDILAIPLSTVASESAFSAGGRHLDPFRSSLAPKMVQALVFSEDWLRARGSTLPMVTEEYVQELYKEFDEAFLDDEVVYVDG